MAKQWGGREVKDTQNKQTKKRARGRVVAFRGRARAPLDVSTSGAFALSPRHHLLSSAHIYMYCYINLGYTNSGHACTVVYVCAPVPMDARVRVWACGCEMRTAA